MRVVLALFAFLVLVAFLMILVLKVASPDLAAVVALTLGLAGFDLFRQVLRRD